MKFILTFWLMCSYTIHAQPLADTTQVQSILLDVNQRQTNFSRMAMTSLNAWAISNITYGSISFGNSHGQERYFHQMNAFWNVVNLGIGVPGLIGTYKEKKLDFESVYKYQKRLENVYILNAGLDVGYMATGWALNSFGKTQTGDLGERFKGYGNSIVMQGAYLFVHDIIVYLLYRSNNRQLNILWNNVSIQPTGLGVVIQLH